MSLKARSVLAIIKFSDYDKLVKQIIQMTGACCVEPITSPNWVGNSVTVIIHYPLSCSIDEEIAKLETIKGVTNVTENVCVGSLPILK